MLYGSGPGPACKQNITKQMQDAAITNDWLKVAVSGGCSKCFTMVKGRLTLQNESLAHLRMGRCICPVGMSRAAIHRAVCGTPYGAVDGRPRSHATALSIIIDGVDPD